MLASITWTAIKALIRTQFPQVRSLSVTELAAQLLNYRFQDNQLQDNQLQDSQFNQPPYLLDVRSLEEYQVSHLAHAHWMPEESLQNGKVLPDPLPDPTSPIVVYCSVGYRSAKVAAQLQQMGWEQVFNLEGSIFEWANAGYPLYCGTEPVAQVHPYNALWGTLLRPELRAPLPTHPPA